MITTKDMTEFGTGKINKYGSLKKKTKGNAKLTVKKTRVKKMGDKLYRETKVKQIHRKTVIPTNKLPLLSKKFLKKGLKRKLKKSKSGLDLGEEKRVIGRIGARGDTRGLWVGYTV